MFAWIALLWMASADAACEPDALEPAVDAAEAAFTAGDGAALASAWEHVDDALPCQAATLPPPLVSRIHRARALHLHQQGDHDEAVLALRAMLHADPFASLPESLVPTHHALRVLLVRAQEADWRWTPLKNRSGEMLYVDGSHSTVAPAIQPYLLQKVDDAGALTSTRLVERGAAPLERGVVQVAENTRPPKPSPVPRPAAERSPVSPAAKRLRWASLGLGVGAGALYGGAWASNSAYFQAVEAQDDALIRSRHTTTNALSVGSVAAGTTALGTLLLAEMVKR